MKKKFFTYFQDTFNIQLTSSEWYTFACPYCHKSKKAAVNFRIDNVKCWVCGYSRNLILFVSLLENISKEECKLRYYNPDVKTDGRQFDSILGKANKSKSVALPYSYKRIYEHDSEIGDRAVRYLTNRKLDLAMLYNIGVGYCDKHTDSKDSDYYGYIIMPFINNGELVYFNARNFLNPNSYLRYKNPAINKSRLLYNEDALEHMDTICITEGVFSALSLEGYGVALMGKTMSKWQLTKILRSTVKNVNIILDPGCYSNACDMAYNIYREKKTKVIKLDDGDPNDLGYEVISNLIENTDYFSVKQMYQT